MTKFSKSSVAIAAAAVGVLALGACSSGASDQGQDSREASQRPTASSSGTTALPGSLHEVSLHSADGVKCTKYANEKKNQQTFQCSNLTPAAGDKAVVIGLPMKNYIVEVKTLTSAEDPLVSVLLDDEGRPIGSSKSSNRVTWDSKGIPSSQSGWGVGVGAGKTKSNSTIITVTRV